MSKFRSKSINLNDSFEIEKLLDDIEEQQIEQMEIINNKNEEINNLMNENQKLTSLVSEQEREISFLKNEVDNLKALLVQNEQKFRIEMEEKISEIYTIMEISKKIEEQNKEIEKLEQETEEQKKQFKQYSQNELE
ncbi:hypothetical protein ACJA28_00490 [Mesomycoplasma moatsii]|uniref:hypothetical protein n=1 Tax=Mesomycoplasma moatsii TaxID=171287 RepID=UPI0003B6CF56